MSTASQLTAEAIMCRNPAGREALYQRAERDYGKGVADHLREVVEAHHSLEQVEKDIRGSA